MKKKIKIFILTGPANWYSFNSDPQNSSSRYQELHNQAQALKQAKIKNEIKHQTFYHHRASYLVELQPKVTQFKLLLPRAS
jgi:hypothetical protein